MKNQKSSLRYAVYIVVIATALAVAAGIFAFVTTTKQDKLSDSTVYIRQETKKQTESIGYTAQKGTTALAQLKEESGDVVTKKSSYGEYVESIGGLKGGDEGKYWTFYINGKMAQVGADTYVAKGGEEIEWKFEKLQ